MTCSDITEPHHVVPICLGLLESATRLLFHSLYQKCLFSLFLGTPHRPVFSPYDRPSNHVRTTSPKPTGRANWASSNLSRPSHANFPFPFSLPRRFPAIGFHLTHHALCSRGSGGNHNSRHTRRRLVAASNLRSIHAWAGKMHNHRMRKMSNLVLDCAWDTRWLFIRLRLGLAEKNETKPFFSSSFPVLGPLLSFQPFSTSGWETSFLFSIERAGGVRVRRWVCVAGWTAVEAAVFSRLKDGDMRGQVQLGMDGRRFPLRRRGG